MLKKAVDESTTVLELCAGLLALIERRLRLRERDLCAARYRVHEERAIAARKRLQVARELADNATYWAARGAPTFALSLLASAECFID